jgi:pimeloyl-ACP methyl ester carboxylesterase
VTAFQECQLSSERPLQANNPRFFRKARYGTDKFVLVRRTKIHYIEAGQGEPVILIPGTPSTSRIWNRVMPELDANYKLLALDYLPAEDIKTGTKPEAIIREQADTIAEMLRQLGLKKVNLMGGNLGGAVAFNLAARYPDLVERVISLSGIIGFEVKIAKKDGKEAANLLEEEAKAIKCPILYMYGTKTADGELPLARNLEFLQKNHPQAWIIALEGGIFEIALKNPQEITGLMQDFLKFKPGIRIG